MVETQFGYHIIDVTELKNNTSYTIASVEREITPSDETHNEAYRKAEELIDPSRLYTPAEAVALAKETSTTKFDATVEAAFRLVETYAKENGLWLEQHETGIVKPLHDSTPWNAPIKLVSDGIIKTGQPNRRTWVEVAALHGFYAAEAESGARFDFYILPIHTPAPDRQEYQAVFN